ncbi:MAG: DUF3313 domain-containing protein [Methylococcales bacterium]|nr:DUF3313 domain-containing protein [Methylococcales bacterium]
MKASFPLLKKSSFAISMVLGLTIAGCGDTQFRQAPQSSGYLGTYAELKPMPGRRQALFYDNTEADWSSYTQVLIDPVHIQSRKNVDNDSMSLRDRRMLGTYFEHAMRDALSQKYHVVNQAGPGVLRIRAAITNVQSADALINRIGSSIIQVPGGFGQVTLEGELVDSITGDRLAAIVDGKAGSLFESFDNWDDVTAAFDQWAEQLYSVVHGHLGDIPLDTSSHVVAAPAPVAPPVVVAAAPEPEAFIEAAPAVEPEPEPEPIIVIEPDPEPAPVVVKAAPKPKPVVRAAPKPQPKVVKLTPKPAPAVVAAVKAAPKPKPVAVAKPAPVAVAKAPAIPQVSVADKMAQLAAAKPAPKAAFDPWNGKPGAGSANVNEKNLRPFILGLKTKGSVSAVATAAKKRLADAGFSVIGSYSPASNVTILVATNSTLKSHAAKSEFGAYGASVRIAITDAGGNIQVAYSNPNYSNAAYRMKGSLSGVATKLAGALGKIKTFGSADGIEDDDLRDWHYTFSMPYFDDPIELASHSSYQSAVNKVAKNLKAGKAGIKQVYRIDIPGKDETVFGVAITKGIGADKSIMKLIDSGKIKHSAHFPYEIVVSKDTVYTLDGKFRIATSFPDLTMKQFFGIKAAPGEIEEAFEKVAQ